MTEMEKQRAREGLQNWKQRPNISTHEWRFYFSYLLGRDLTLQETDTFLRAEAEASGVQRG